MITAFFDWDHSGIINDDYLTAIGVGHDPSHKKHRDHFLLNWSSTAALPPVRNRGRNTHCDKLKYPQNFLNKYPKS